MYAGESEELRSAPRGTMLASRVLDKVELGNRRATEQVDNEPLQATMGYRVDSVEFSESNSNWSMEADPLTSLPSIP